MSVSTDGGLTFSASLSFATVVTNPLVTTPPFNVNVAFVNLDDFGFAPGATVDAVKLSGLFTGVGGSGPDLLAIAAINAGAPTGNINPIPEPEIYAMMAVGLGLMGWIGRRNKLQTA